MIPQDLTSLDFCEPTHPDTKYTRTKYFDYSSVWLNPRHLVSYGNLLDIQN